ncbi:MAG TPA: alpha-2-macroglobulin family protein [Paludibacteraceae bacterium]|nr:alpha-2-macroglobulin family protein [Paludibacteraceae bacterium]
MKHIKLAIGIVMTLFFATSTATAYDYESAWKKADNSYRKNPLDAMNIIKESEKQAMKEGNRVQQLKAIIYEGTIARVKSDSALDKEIEKLQQFKIQEKDPALHSIATFFLAKAIKAYSYNHQNRRTDLQGVIPENMDEWTPQIFKDTIIKLCDEALAPAKELAQIKTTEFAPLITKGKDSQLFCHTLYDLLCFDIIDFDEYAENKINLYESMIKFHEADQNKDALVYAKQSLILEKYGDLNPETKKKRTKELENLLDQYKEQEASLLTINEIVKFLFYYSEEEKSKPTTPSYLKKMCEDGIARFPKSNLTKGLKSVLKEIEEPIFDLSAQEQTHSGDKIKVNIKYANIENIDLKIYQYTQSQEEILLNNENKKNSKLIKTVKVKLNKTNYYIKKDTAIELDPLDYGHYFITTSLTKDIETDIYVSDLSIISCLSYKDDGKRFFVADSKTGAPIENVTASFYYRNQKTNNSISDKNGFIEYKSAEEDRVLFSIGKDKHLSAKYCNIWKNLLRNNEQNFTSVLTDRAIYRPGQTVYFKAILGTLHDNDSNMVISSKKKITVELRDANYQIIETKELETNEFGSINGSFVIPTNKLSGNFCIIVDNESQYFKVEEYKRPTFEVDIDKPQGSYSFGDKITTSGSAKYLIGTELDKAKVKYTISKMPYWSWYWGGGQKEIIEQKDTITDSKGVFSITFTPKKNEEERMATYRYSISAEITDNNGETQSKEIYIVIGDRSMVLNFPLNERTLTDSLCKQKLYVTNLNGEGIEKEISYSIQSENNQTKLEGKISSDKKGTAYLPTSVSKLESGKYKITFKGLDDQNREVCDSFTTILYRKTDKRPPVESPLWFEAPDKNEYKWNDKISFRFGSSFQDAYLLSVIEDENGIVEQQWNKLNNEIKGINYIFKKENGYALTFHFYIVKNNKFYSEEFDISRENEDKTLPVKLTVFRDKTTPGAKETWTLNVAKTKEAEVLASMYDASLDLISPLSWRFSPIYQRSILKLRWNYPDFGVSYPISHYPSGYNDLYNLSLDHFIDIEQQLEIPDRNAVFLCVSEDMSYGRAYSMPSPTARAGGNLNEVQSLKAKKVQISNAKEEAITDNEKPTFRTNFAETAFFYPQLRTDESGNVTFSFQMPESLTKWKFMALAHTKDLFYGQTMETIIAKKEFMISPNLPRFVRQGDHCVFSAKITNLSDAGTNGIAIIELADAENDKTLIKKETKFEVSADSSVTVFWDVDIPTDKELIVVRVFGKSDKLTDGEQKLLPVLTDRTIVTQSLPLFVRDEGKSTFTFTQMKENKSTTLQNRFMKLEFTSNPIWYAVQALPSVSVPEYDCVQSLTAAHYATALSEYIAKSNPQISNIINIWKQQSADKKTLLSNLMKNEEVKNILLNETPWVMEANNETDQKQRLSLLLDINEQQNKKTEMLDRLNKLRNSDGSYSWFAGMNGSQYLTQIVLTNFGRLRKLGAANYNENEMAKMKESFGFIDHCMKEDFDNLKKYYPKDYQKRAYISMTDLNYFYIKTLFPEISTNKEAKPAYEFYLSIIKKQWSDLSLYGKALAAIIMQKNNDAKEAKNIIESLRQYATVTKDKGMYWEKNKSGYFWHESTIGTQAAILEAFAEVGCPASEIDDMRTWLLQQKRTQQWGSTTATVDAIYALLLNGSDWLKNKNEVSIQLGNETVATEAAEAGTGYINQFYNAENIKPEMATVTIDKKGTSPAWGAIYWQFSEKMDKVEKSKCDLQVEKAVMLEQNGNNKKVLVPITDKTNLKVGDKLVVRLTIRAHRDLEYVALKDQRAACLEPKQQLSSYRFTDGIGYYQSPKDASMQYFFDYLRKGTYVLEYPLYVTHSGEYSNGIATLQCLYAPEFVSNTDGVRIKVEK